MTDKETLFIRKTVRTLAGSFGIATLVVALMTLFGQELVEASRGVAVAGMIVAGLCLCSVLAVSWAVGKSKGADALRVWMVSFTVLTVAFGMLFPLSSGFTWAGYLFEAAVLIVSLMILSFYVPADRLPSYKRYAWIASCSLALLGALTAWEVGLQVVGTRSLLGGMAVAALFLATGFWAGERYASHVEADPYDAYNN